MLYLTEHVTAGKHPRYRVRPYDVRKGVLQGALVDRLEWEEQEMGGEPIARASSRDGRWAYTLYARRKDVPFVHALDTVKRQAYCIGLPVRVGYNGQWRLRLRLDGTTLAVAQGRRIARDDRRRQLEGEPRRGRVASSVAFAISRATSTMSRFAL